MCKLKNLLKYFLFSGMMPGALLAQRGPGLGNLQYTSAEQYKSIWRFTEVNHYGSNIATLHNGYLVTTFTPDSGKPPGGILVWDVSNPRRPVRIARIYDSRTASLRESHALPQSGNYVLFQDGCGFQAWDFSDPANPKQAKRFCISGYSHNDYGATWQMFWQAPYIYIANGRGFDIVDASDILNPVYVKHVNTTLQVGPIFAVGNLLITSAHDKGKGISIFDISNPRDPKLLSAYTATENMYASFVNGNKIIISARGNTNNAIFSTYDFSNPTAIRKVATLNIGNSGEQLYSSTQDNFIFQGCQNEVVKIDATNASSLRVTGRGSLGISGDSDHGQVSPFGNLIFVGNDHGSGSGFWVHQTSPDRKAPEVNMVSPKLNEVNRALTSRIGVTLTDNIILESINNKTFVVRPVGGAALAGKYSHQFSTINFSPDQPLKANTTYEIVIPQGGIKDYAGNAFGTTFTSYFSTGSSGNFLPSGAGNAWVVEKNDKVDLFWNSIPNAEKYNVKRSTSAAGPFVSIGMPVTRNFVDVNVDNDKTYYYTISGVNAIGEGPASLVLKAIPSIYITDLAWVSATNAWGPAEVDQSNGEQLPDDGTTISIGGQTYSRGIGVNAASTIVYNLGGKYQRFISNVGVDDEVGTNGSVAFKVVLDGREIYNSGLMTGNASSKLIDVSVLNGKQLSLIVTPEGTDAQDHASWGGARLIPAVLTNLADINSGNNGISIYPNPAIDEIIISSSATVTELLLVDMHGKTVYHSTDAFSGIKTVQLKDITTSGIYFIKLKQDDQFNTIKINIK